MKLLDEEMDGVAREERERLETINEELEDVKRRLQRVWGLRGSGDSRRVRTAAKQLRRKLGDDANNPTYILNEPRVGYRMEKGDAPEREKGLGGMDCWMTSDTNRSMRRGHR